MAEPLDSPSLRVSSDSTLVARYRRLQSWYRSERLGVAPGTIGKSVVGSAVPKELHRGLNFLTPGAWEHAEERIVAVQAEGGTLEADRLLRNLLSSMPMCFNIFGSLRKFDGFADLIGAVFDAEASTAVDAMCEWAPQKETHLNDRSAFDAVVRYATSAGEERFVGVETKYTELFSTPEYSRPQYEKVTKESGWFTADAFDVLPASPAKQLWRTVMLAAAYSASSGITGRAAVVCLAEDKRAADVVALVQQHMTEPQCLVHVTLESLVAVASTNADPQVVEWAARFGGRYLDADRLGLLSA